MRFIATPYTLTVAGMMDSRRDLFPSEENFVSYSEWYNARPSLGFDDITDERAILEETWMAYQDYTPDRKQSMQMGDMVRLRVDHADGNLDLSDRPAESWWLCKAIGWAEIPKPTWAIVRI